MSVLSWLQTAFDRSATDEVMSTIIPVAWMGRTSTDDQQDPTLSLPRQLENTRRALPAPFVIVAKFYDIESGRNDLELRGQGDAHERFDIRPVRPRRPRAAQSPRASGPEPPETSAGIRPGQPIMAGNRRTQPDNMRPPLAAYALVRGGLLAGRRLDDQGCPRQDSTCATASGGLGFVELPRQP
jgi:hypothetical protein